VLIVTSLVLVALLAFANGSNDNCKGVPTLVGFGEASPGRALVWAAMTTAARAVLSFWFSGGLIKAFSTGLLAAGTAPGAAFFAAVLVGAIAWIFTATFTGLPVSTTHAITGGLVGAGVVSFSAGQVRCSAPCDGWSRAAIEVAPRSRRAPEGETLGEVVQERPVRTADDSRAARCRLEVFRKDELTGEPGVKPDVPEDRPAPAASHRLWSA
jgi:hypothetical protein